MTVLRVTVCELECETAAFEDEWSKAQGAKPLKRCAFDAVVSTFGVMFAPDQQRAASELARVCRSGGRIGLANWTPDGFIGQLFKVNAKHVPPPALRARGFDGLSQPPAARGRKRRAMSSSTGSKGGILARAVSSYEPASTQRPPSSTSASNVRASGSTSQKCRMPCAA